MFERFIKEKNPAVCVTGNFDITNIYRLKSKHCFNTLMCYCITKAAQKIDEFHYSIDENNQLYYYQDVKTNFAVTGNDGELYWADCKYCDGFEEFEKEYEKGRDYCFKNCEYYKADTGALISTSAVVNFPFTAFSIDNSDIFWDSFLLWGKYVLNNDKVNISITLRFHHAIMGAQHAGMFFEQLQKEFDNFVLG